MRLRFFVLGCSFAASLRLAFASACQTARNVATVLFYARPGPHPAKIATLKGTPGRDRLANRSGLWYSRRMNQTVMVEQLSGLRAGAPRLVGIDKPLRKELAQQDTARQARLAKYSDRAARGLPLFN